MFIVEPGGRDCEAPLYVFSLFSAISRGGRPDVEPQPGPALSFGPNLLINFDFIDTYHSLTVPLQTLRYLRQNVSEAGQRAGLEDHSNVETNFTRQQFNTTLYLAAVFTVYLVGLAILLLDHARQEALPAKPGGQLHV